MVEQKQKQKLGEANFVNFYGRYMVGRAISITFWLSTLRPPIVRVLCGTRLVQLFQFIMVIFPARCSAKKWLIKSAH